MPYAYANFHTPRTSECFFRDAFCFLAFFFFFFLKKIYIKHLVKSYIKQLLKRIDPAKSSCCHILLISLICLRLKVIPRVIAQF
jgi:hypothetical protein